jgi:hypothetical protein
MLVCQACRGSPRRSSSKLRRLIDGPLELAQFSMSLGGLVFHPLPYGNSIFRHACI